MFGKCFLLFYQAVETNQCFHTWWEWVQTVSISSIWLTSPLWWAGVTALEADRDPKKVRLIRLTFLVACLAKSCWAAKVMEGTTRPSLCLVVHDGCGFQFWHIIKLLQPWWSTSVLLHSVLFWKILITNQSRATENGLLVEVLSWWWTKVGSADFLAPLPLASRIEGLLLPGTRNAGGSATLALRPGKITEASVPWLRWLRQVKLWPVSQGNKQVSSSDVKIDFSQGSLIL